MARLSLFLFGPFQLTLDHSVAARFESNKVRALLAFLTVECDRPHPRHALAELFWPAQPAPAVRSNFRRALANLRTVIDDRIAHPPCLLITHETVQFNPQGDAFVDIARYRTLVKTPITELTWAENLAEAAALYRGPFLEGFAVNDCPEFEQWMTITRSELALSAATVLCWLAEHHAIRAKGALALPFFRRCLAIDPYHEAALRGLMRLLADNAQRSAALLQYATFRRRLLDDLGAEPEAQTIEVAEVIRQGRSMIVSRPQPPMDTAASDAGWPTSGRETDCVAIARTEQLALLYGCAKQTEQRHGCTAFVVGESGSGKTSLLCTFASQIRRSDQPWLAAFGACTALLGVGDPYQPFIDSVRMLAGCEIGTRHENEPPSDHATVASLLRAEAPDWANLAQIERYGETCIDLWERVAPASLSTAQPLNVAFSGASDAQPAFASQPSLHHQLVRFLERLALLRPLLLELDNLQWADAGTLSLLFHLAQRLEHSRILIVGAYRPSARIRAEYSYPLSEIVQELRQQPGAVLIDLDQADGRQFVDALLGCEPNRLDEEFRTDLLQHTEGHALFTVEMLRALSESGHFGRDQSGCWRVDGKIDWDILPPRIEALIRRCVDCLSAADRALLNAASVEGDEFTAEMAAAASGIDPTLAIERLSGDLTTRYCMVHAIGVRRHACVAVTRYRFRHHLFRAYLYAALDEVQRERLRQAVAAQTKRLLIM